MDIFNSKYKALINNKLINVDKLVINSKGNYNEVSITIKDKEYSCKDVPLISSLKKLIDGKYIYEGDVFYVLHSGYPVVVLANDYNIDAYSNNEIIVIGNSLENKVFIKNKKVTEEFIHAFITLKIPFTKLNKSDDYTILIKSMLRFYIDYPQELSNDLSYKIEECINKTLGSV